MNDSPFPRVTGKITVRVNQSGRFWAPWNFHVTDGVMRVGEPGIKCTAWSRQRAIRAGLKMASWCADNHIARGEPADISVIVAVVENDQEAR